MFYGDTIQDTRQIFFTSWDKYLQKFALSALEQQVINVILAHPEYHKMLENRGLLQNHAYYPELGETNPFLHMGLHLAVREQIATDRPVGIQAIYTNLIEKYHDSLKVEHLIMDQLAECLWLAQKNNTPPDEHHYLHSLSKA